jgi:hypothetical protein
VKKYVIAARLVALLAPPVGLVLIIIIVKVYAKAAVTNAAC